jgi:hypothetical protein
MVLRFIGRFDGDVEKTAEFLVRYGPTTLDNIGRDTLRCSDELRPKRCVPPAAEAECELMDGDRQCVRSLPGANVPEVSHAPA